MVRTSLLTALCIILIGFGVPTVCIYFSVMYQFDALAAVIIALPALIVAGILAFTGMAIGSGEVPSETIKPSERERLNLLRAHQRATLEELDDIIEVLREIKDVLKSAQE